MKHPAAAKLRSFMQGIWVALAAAVLLAPQVAVPRQTSGGRQPSAAEFTDHDAAGLLGRIADGMQTRNHNKVLAAFDLRRMAEGPLFRQQIVSLISHSDSIRIHINLVKTAEENGKGVAEADVEMEVARRDDSNPVHQQARLRFTADKAPSGWKFIDVQPRAFFALP